MAANEYITIDSNSYEKVETFKYLILLLIDQNYIQRGTKM